MFPHLPRSHTRSFSTDCCTHFVILSTSTTIHLRSLAYTRFQRHQRAGTLQLGISTSLRIGCGFWTGGVERTHAWLGDDGVMAQVGVGAYGRV